MAYGILLTNDVAFEDPEVREFFLDRGGMVDGNAMLANDVPDELEELILERGWGELVPVEVFSDEEAAEFAGVEADFDEDPDAAEHIVGEELDAQGRTWVHYGRYGTAESTWVIVVP
ncbi:MAG: hypothetical protein ACOYEW_14520 [Anaerolineae bacterium]|jgi:hypothetical protein